MLVACEEVVAYDGMVICDEVVSCEEVMSCEEAVSCEVVARRTRATVLRAPRPISVAAVVNVALVVLKN
jgi:hypothetical protein